MGYVSYKIIHKSFGLDFKGHLYTGPCFSLQLTLLPPGSPFRPSDTELPVGRSHSLQDTALHPCSLCSFCLKCLSPFSPSQAMVYWKEPMQTLPCPTLSRTLREADTSPLKSFGQNKVEILWELGEMKSCCLFVHGASLSRVEGAQGHTVYSSPTRLVRPPTNPSQ